MAMQMMGPDLLDEAGARICGSTAFMAAAMSALQPGGKLGALNSVCCILESLLGGRGPFSPQEALASPLLDRCVAIIFIFLGHLSLGAVTAEHQLCPAHPAL